MFWSIHRLIILVCYSFIFGIVTGMFIYTPAVERVPDIIRVFYLLAGASLMVTAYKKTSGTTAFVLAALAMWGGWATYTKAVDTTDPNHIVHFVKGGSEEPVTVRGVIAGDPDVRERYTNVSLNPETIRIGDETFEISGGNLLIRLYPNRLKSYGQYEYGDRIEVTAPLVVPRPLSNPGGFDYRKWLVNHGMYATMQVRTDLEIKKMERVATNALTQFALDMKYKFIRATKLTMPFVESSFLGGVTLGLKGGVTQQTRFEFQATGVAHVLAVSGLHVGFVAALLIMLAHLFKLPGKFQPPFVMCGLVIFSIITGNSPATVRACIMFSLFISIKTYMRDMGIIGATLLTIPIAAFCILYANPLLLMDASFLLSFGAVLSLGLLTVPVQALMNRALVGIKFIAAVFTVAAVTLIAHFGWDLFFQKESAIPIFGSLAALWIFASHLQRKYPDRVRFGFDSIHPWLGAFIAAQVAINLGNSPLFALYFNRLSISGWYANLICIPLCGVVVQLGLIADLLFLIPYIGPPLGALVNGGNYLCCKLFLGTAHFFAENFPYPYAPTPTVEFSAVYYGALFVFIYHEWVGAKLRTVWAWWKYRNQFPQYSPRAYAAMGVAAAVLLAAGSYYVQAAGNSEKRLRVTFFDVGKASATLIETPGGKNILVDGGMYEAFRDFDAGRSVIGPAFSEYGVHFIDHLVLTTFAVEHVGGLPYLSRNFHVRHFVEPLPPELCGLKTDFQDFAANWSDAGYGAMAESKAAVGAFEQYLDLVHRLEEMKVPRENPAAELTLVEEDGPGGRLTVTVFPVGMERNGEEDTGATPLDEQLRRMRGAGPTPLMVKIEYGRTVMLVTGDLDERQMRDMAAAAANPKSKIQNLKSDLLLAPSHGMAYEESFVKAVGPTDIVVQFRPGFARRNEPTEASAVPMDLPGVKIFRTDQSGAVLAFSNGLALVVRPFGGTGAEDDFTRAHEF